MRKVRLLLEMAKYIILNEGVIPFIKRFISLIRHQFFFRQSYYLYGAALTGRTEPEYFPKIQDAALHIISSNSDVNRLTADGFIFNSWQPIYRYRLDKGAIAFCVFAGKELAHVHWAAVNETGRASLGEPPVKVNFENNEVVSGDSWTKPEFRGMGLARYAAQKRVDYMGEHGKTISRGSVRKANTEGQRVSLSPSKDMVAEARHLKILWWESWKETPLDSE